MARFKIVTTAGPGTGRADHSLEMEALAAIGAEIVEVTGGEDELASRRRRCRRDLRQGPAAHHRQGDRRRQEAEGRVAGQRRRRFGRCRCRRPQLGIPVTNCPDTFIEEVADHAMTLILASWRRLVVQDQMVRKGDWAKARPMLYQFPRLMGMTLGFISFGHVARAVAKRAAPFGFQMLAYDPYIEELVMSDYGVQPVGLDELLQRSDIISMHAPGTKDAHHLMKEAALQEDEEDGAVREHRPRLDGRRGGDDQGAAGRLDRRRRPRRARDRAGRPQQSAARHGQRHPDRARRLGVEPLRHRRASAASAPSWRWCCAASGRAPASIPRCWRSPSSQRWQPFSMERGPGN